MKLPLSPKAVLIDLAGVLHVGDQPLPGAVAALRQLRASGMPVRFLTNTTRSPRAAIVDMLRQMGFEIAPEEVQTAVLATQQYVMSRWQAPYWLAHPAIAGEIGASHPEPDVVVLGDAGEHFTFARLNEAFRLLMRGLPFVAMAKNRYFQEADGLTIDMGAYVSALEFASGQTATIIGKPSRHFFLGALQALGVAPGEAVLIGDDLRDDIGGAQEAGIAGVLVRTGKFRAGDDAHAEIQPALVADDFAAAVSVLLGQG